MREKLIELLSDVQYLGGLEEKIADHLIANGVTVQGDKDINVPTKWISVKDRLPIPYHKVLVVDRVTGLVTTARMNDFNSFVFEDGRGHGASYWMPLPTPPKGE